MDIEELLRQRYGGDRFNPAAGQTQMSFQEWMDRHPSLRGRGGAQNFDAYRGAIMGEPASPTGGPREVDIPDGAKGRGGNLGPTVPQPPPNPADFRLPARKPNDGPVNTNFPMQPIGGGGRGWVNRPTGPGGKNPDRAFGDKGYGMRQLGSPDMPPKGKVGNVGKVAGSIKAANKGMPRPKAGAAAKRRAEKNNKPKDNKQRQH